MLARAIAYLFLFSLATGKLIAQETDSLQFISGLIYNEDYEPVPACHVINVNNYRGDVTDSIGLFRLEARPGDTLLIRNIVYRDTLVAVASMEESKIIKISKAVYELPGTRVYEWGSSYNDFREAVVRSNPPISLGEQLGLPVQDPEYVPFNMDEEYVGSLGFLITSPVSYLYENFNRKARNRRKIYWLKRNRALHDRFDEITSPENLSSLTGLKGDDLLGFMAFLFGKMKCDYRCDEIDIYSEIHRLWNLYRDDSSIK